jgi:hypothetical protein
VTVNATNISPTSADLIVEEPEENGGMPVTHYVVEYEKDVLNFAAGNMVKHTLLTYFFVIILCYGLTSLISCRELICINVVQICQKLTRPPVKFSLHCCLCKHYTADYCVLKPESFPHLCHESIESKFLRSAKGYV